MKQLPQSFSTLAAIPRDTTCKALRISGDEKRCGNARLCLTGVPLPLSHLQLLSMMWGSLGLLLVSALFPVRRAAAERCPRICLCDNIKYHVSCLNKNLTEVPITIPQVSHWGRRGRKKTEANAAQRALKLPPPHLPSLPPPLMCITTVLTLGGILYLPAQH